jgi:hypothetical protein
MILESRSDPANHWVSFDLEGSPQNRLALNARVWVTTGKATQMDEVRSGGSYLSQSDLRLHFGLGRSARIDKVEVLWPNGGRQVFENIASDRFYHLKQGGVLPTDKEAQPAGVPR